MRAFWRVFDGIVDGLAALGGFILVFINVAVCYGIAMRYFFQSPPIWVVQTTEYALLWIVFLGTTWLLREKGHVNVDIVHSHLPEGVKRALDTVMYLLAAVACGAIFVLSTLYCQDCVVNSITDVRAVTVPKWSVFVVIPIGSFFLTVQFLRMAWDRASRPTSEGET